MSDAFSPILQGILLILAAPALTGWIGWLKARMQGRRRSWLYIFQPYLNLVTLFRTPATHPQTASWVFAAAPWILFASYAWLAFIIPVFCEPLLAVDFIVVIYVLGFGHFTLSLAGWDAGSAFGNLGGSRVTFFHFLTEIGLILFFAALALRWETINLKEIFDQHASILQNLLVRIDLETFSLNFGVFFLVISLFLIILFEMGRLPVDNPDTHMELTMTYKAVLLEFSGRDLALVEWAEMVKTMFLFSMFSNLFLPIHSLSYGAAIPLFIAELLILGCLLVWWEIRQARSRIQQTPGFAWVTLLFSLLAMLLTLAIRNLQP